MPLLPRRMLAGGKSLALLRDHVHEARTGHLADRREGVHERVDVVAVDRAEVAEPQLLEQDAGGEERLDTLLPLADDRRDRRRRRLQQLADLVAQAVVERVPLDRRQVLVHRTDVGRDRHLVVIEHDHDVALRVAGVVEPLVGEARRERAVAEDRDDLELLAVDVARRRHAQGGRDRGRGVAGAEGVVRAFGALEEAGDALLLPERLHPRVAPGQELVRIALVPHVPDQLVLRRLEDVVQCDRQLDDPEAGADVAAGSRADVDHPGAEVGGEDAQLVARERPKVGGGIDAVE